MKAGIWVAFGLALILVCCLYAAIPPGVTP